VDIDLVGAVIEGGGFVEELLFLALVGLALGLSRVEGGQ